MARKKKKVDPVQIETKPVESDIKATGIQNIGYQGKVAVKINHGNKTIMTKEYHNNGMPQLFKFLCNALAGSYSDALRPCKIKLFYYPDAENTAPTAFNWTTAFMENAAIKPKGITPFRVYESMPVIKKQFVNSTSGNSEYYYTTTFHFRLPFTLISDTIIHAVGLFSNNIYQGMEADASAYYLFTTENGQEWDPIELENVVGNFSLIIDWTMAIMNKPITEATNN